MEDLQNKSIEELVTLTKESDDKDVLRAIANLSGVKYSGNTSVETLKTNILAELDEPDREDEDEEQDDENDPVMLALKAKQAEPVVPKPSKKKKNIMDLPRTALAELDPRTPGLTEVEKRAIVRSKAMRLHRVRIANLDPNDSAVPGAIKTVYNKYTGKVSKYIPYGEENEHGYHVPEILLNALKTETYNMRKEIKQKGSSFGVKQYKTVQMKKFSIEYLPELTEQELVSLGNDQKARGALDSSE